MTPNGTPVVISFGIPRSGTTLVERMFERGRGYYYQKMAEGVRMHPMQQPFYLTQVAGLFRRSPLAFVRTVRHPVDVAASWTILDPGITVDRVIECFRRESENYWGQLPLLGGLRRGGALVSAVIRFEDLGDPVARNRLFRSLTDVVPAANVGVWAGFLDEVWNRRPVRDGRMARGLDGEQSIPDEWVERILSELGDVIEAEGLSGQSRILRLREGGSGAGHATQEEDEDRQGAKQAAVGRVRRVGRGRRRGAVPLHRPCDKGGPR